jgi:hypothetical protein
LEALLDKSGKKQFEMLVIWLGVVWSVSEVGYGIDSLAGTQTRLAVVAIPKTATRSVEIMIGHEFPLLSLGASLFPLEASLARDMVEEHACCDMQHTNSSQTMRVVRQGDS